MKRDGDNEELPEPSRDACQTFLTPELKSKFERKGEALVVQEISRYGAFEKRQAAVDWMEEKRRKRDSRDARRFWVMFITAVIGTLAAIVAAVASVWPLVF